MNAPRSGCPINLTLEALGTYYCNPSGHLINPSANVQPADITLSRDSLQPWLVRSFEAG